MNRDKQTLSPSPQGWIQKPLLVWGRAGTWAQPRPTTHRWRRQSFDCRLFVSPVRVGARGWGGWGVRVCLVCSLRVPWAAALPPPGAFGSCLARERTFQVGGPAGAAAWFLFRPTAVRSSRHDGSAGTRIWVGSCRLPPASSAGRGQEELSWGEEGKADGVSGHHGPPALEGHLSSPESKGLILRWRQRWPGGPALCLPFASRPPF